MSTKFNTFYLNKMPSHGDLNAIENITDVEINEVIYETPAVNVYTIQVIKLLEVKALLASMGYFIDKQTVGEK